MSTAQVFTAIAAVGALGLSVFNTARAELKLKPRRGVRVELISGTRYRLVNYGRKKLIVTSVFAEPTTSDLGSLEKMFSFKPGDVVDFEIKPIRLNANEPFPTRLRITVEDQVGWMFATIPPPSS